MSAAARSASETVRGSDASVRSPDAETPVKPSQAWDNKHDIQPVMILRLQATCVAGAVAEEKNTVNAPE